MSVDEKVKKSTENSERTAYAALHKLWYVAHVEHHWNNLPSSLFVSSNDIKATSSVLSPHLCKSMRTMDELWWGRDSYIAQIFAKLEQCLRKAPCTKDCWIEDNISHNHMVVNVMLNNFMSGCAQSDDFAVFLEFYHTMTAQKKILVNQFWQQLDMAFKQSCEVFPYEKPVGDQDKVREYL